MQIQQILSSALQLFSPSQVLFSKSEIGSDSPNLKTNTWMEGGVLAFSKPQSEVERLGVMMQLLQDRDNGTEEEREKERERYQEEEEKYEEHFKRLGGYKDEGEQGEGEDGWVTEEQGGEGYEIQQGQQDEYQQEGNEGYESETVNPILHSKIV